MRTQFRGFSLIELMVVVTIIGILASIVYANFGGSSTKARDAERQSDLRILQTAITQYKQKYSKYPEAGCSVGAGNWAHESTCAVYIKDLVPEFLPRLPKDPKRGSHEGYSYVTNADQSVYKLMAMNTVEDDVLTYTHPFKSCDVKPNETGGYPASTDIDKYGWCASLQTQHLGGINGQSANCKMSSDSGNGRFDSSYAVWGGFAANAGEQLNRRLQVSNTTIIICK